MSFPDGDGLGRGRVVTSKDHNPILGSVRQILIDCDGQALGAGQDQMVLYYDFATNSIKVKTITNTSVSEVQFLQQKADAGLLITVHGTQAGAVGAVASYTPAAGKIFVHFKSLMNVIIPAGGVSVIVQLRNNGTVKSAWNNFVTASTGIFGNQELLAKGDILTGDGRFGSVGLFNCSTGIVPVGILYRQRLSECY